MGALLRNKLIVPKRHADWYYGCIIHTMYVESKNLGYSPVDTSPEASLARFAFRQSQKPLIPVPQPETLLEKAVRVSDQIAGKLLGDEQRNDAPGYF